MEYLQFSSLSENDFDEIVLDAGGKRYPYNPKNNELNCDYILDDVVIELKIIEEEPIEKEEKQKKFIELFPADVETVILYPRKEQKYSYYKILENPIKKALKKASKQLQVSETKVNANLKIAIIMNNGLYMVSQKEFIDIAIRRAKNDTSGIDILIICSMHYYSDKFEMITLFEFKDFEINNVPYQNKKQIIEKLRSSWNKKMEQYMTEQITNPKLHREKEPIKDLVFESNGIRYVKPPIRWGKKSDFWMSSRPREDTSIDNDLPLIVILPIFNNESYSYVKQYLINKEILKDSLEDYMEWVDNNPRKFKNKIQLTVYVELTNKDLERNQKPFKMNDIQQYANIKYEKFYGEIEQEMEEYSENVNSNNYILVEIQEIGIDKANDIAFISHIVNNSKQEWLVHGIRIKYEYAIHVAISFCMMLNAEKVYYIRNEDFKWK